MKKNNKGFTLFELVVVIFVSCIIMVTCAISFISLIKKARLNADASFIRSANEIIDKSTTTINSIDSAISLLSENGYSENSLLAKLPEDHIVYDSLNNRFLLIDDNGKVIYSDKKANPENYIILVITESDLNVKCAEGKMYLYKDIVSEKLIKINSANSLYMNGKSITTTDKVKFECSSSKNVVITNGSIVAESIEFSTKEANIILGLDSVLEAKNFVINSQIKMTENSSITSKSTFVLKDNVTFAVTKATGAYTLNFPAKVDIGKGVKLSIDGMAREPENSDDFVLSLASGESFYISASNMNSLVDDGKGHYKLASGYYCLTSDITLDKPLIVEQGQSVTLNLEKYSVTVESDRAVVVNGEFRAVGKSTSTKTAIIKGGRYVIYNSGVVEINKVNIIAGNTEDANIYYVGEEEQVTFGIYNSGADSVLTLNDSAVVKANTGIRSDRGTVYINNARITGKEFSFDGAGTVRIGTVNIADAIIELQGVCRFKDLTRDIVIGIAGKTNNNIVISSINDLRNGENVVNNRVR